MGTIKVGFKEKSIYSVGMLGKEISMGMINVYFMLFLTCFIGLNGIAVGFAMCGIRLFTVFFDPFMAMLINNTKVGKLGRFRPWIMGGAVINSAILIVLFIPLSGSAVGLQYFYYLFLYLLWNITYTAIEVPITSMLPSLADSTHERESISSIARLIGGFGGFIIGSGGSVLIGALSGASTNPRNYFIVAVVGAVILLACSAALTFGIKERVSLPSQSIRFKDIFRLFKENNQVRAFSWSYLLINLGISIAVIQIIYLFIYSPQLELSPHYLIFNIVSCAGQGVAMIFYTLITKKIPREKLFSLTYIFGIIGLLAMFGATFLLGANSWVNVIILSFAGSFLMIANGINQITSTVMITDVVDYGEYISGIRSDSVMISVQTMLTKVSGSLALLVIGIAVAAAKLPPIDLITNTFSGEISDKMLMILYIFLFLAPVPILPIGLLIYKKKYKLFGKFYDDIKLELDARRAAALEAEAQGGASEGFTSAPEQTCLQVAAIVPIPAADAIDKEAED